MQQRINEEFQERKAVGSQVINLYSAYYISSLCENTSAMAEQTSLRLIAPPSPPSPTLNEIEVQQAKAVF